MATAIFYASSTGNTKDAATKIGKNLEINDIFDIGSKDIHLINNYDNVIFGCSTWGEGDLQDDWEDVWENFKALDFKGKTVALFGLGDQESYSDNYLDAMGTTYEVVTKNGGKVVGFWSIEDYDFDESTAQVGDQFVGLALDEDNQSEMSDDRIKEWCDQIRSSII